MKTKTKQKTEAADSGAPDFSSAKVRYEKASAEYNGLREAVENTKAAFLWENTSDADRASLAPAIRERARAAFPKFLPRRAKLTRQAEDAAEALEDATPKYEIERELWAAACRRETERVALELQPRHRAAVKAIAKALEALSLAMAEETETRAELARTAPEPVCAYLPNCSGFLAFGSLAAWDSPASVWARHMRQLQILE